VSFIQTLSGKKFYFDSPEDFHYTIHEIAWALSHINRFTGHGTRVYTVAEHIVNVCELAGNTVHALLHDASEAYLGDVSAPLKRHPVMSGYRLLEQRVQHAIYTRFLGPDYSEADQVLTREADMMMLAREKHWLFQDDLKWESVEAYTSTPPILCLSPLEAYKAFMEKYREITGRNT